jgi:hypothetical protein
MLADVSSGAYNRLAQGATTARIYGELVTSADMRYADFDPVEVYHIDGRDIVLDDRDQYEWWRQ